MSLDSLVASRSGSSIGSHSLDGKGKDSRRCGRSGRSASAQYDADVASSSASSVTQPTTEYEDTALALANSEEPMARKPWYEGPWKKIRLEILERDHRRCQIKGPGCTGEASEVDHITPVSMGGQWWEHENLRASCSRCNQMRNIKRTITPSRLW